MYSLLCEPSLCLWIVLSVASARAPGDADSLCTGASGGVQPAPLPANAKVLMDSHNYILLLPRSSGGVWQQVDLDNTNEGRRGTEWNQNTNIPCRQSVTVCGFEVGPQNNWLITQYISRRVGDILLPQVSIQMLFELVGCVDLACQRTFVIHVYETSTENSTIARETSNYWQVSRVAPGDDTGQTSQNQTIEANFGTDAEGFYVAIRDETTCIVLQRLIVFYNICPGGPGDLVMRPETIAPPISRISHPLEVTAQCVEGASPSGRGEVGLNCNQGGVWSAISGSGCSCDSGFNMSADGTSCIALCGAEEYYSVTSAECRVCPANSVGGDSGLSGECPCAMGYYRADGEEDLACTRLSSGEEYNITVTTMNGVSSRAPNQNATSAPLLVATTNSASPSTVTQDSLATTPSTDRVSTSITVMAALVAVIVVQFIALTITVLACILCQMYSSRSKMSSTMSEHRQSYDSNMEMTQNEVYGVPLTTIQGTGCGNNEQETVLDS